MSFKRDGDNPDLLGNLRKRRVQELFAENIPEDEAFLMRCGRFACTVCHHRPVFDTVNILAAHRQGKKHLGNLHIHQQKKKDLEELISKRKQSQYMKDGTTDINLPTSQSRGILGTCRYDPRSKRSKVKPYDRKVRLNLGETSSEVHTKEEKKTSLPGYTKTLYERSDPLVHSHRLKHVFSGCDKGTDNHMLSPYLRNRTGVNAGSSQHVIGSGSHAGHSGENHYISNNSRTLPGESVSLVTLAPPPPPPPPPESCDESSVKPKKCQAKGKGERQTHVPTAVTEKQLKAEQYLRLTESGWKRDRGGNWVKDENAEFDSDEETPTLQ